MNSEIETKAGLIESKLRPIAGVVLHLQSILNWEKPYHAPLLGSAITMIFMLFWLIDASVLSKLCILGIIVVSLDFGLPIVNSLVSKKEWIEKNEEVFKDTCKSLAIVWYQVSSTYTNFCTMKRTNTKMYYSIVLSTLLILAWVGSLVHNLLLTYLVTLGIALYPGLQKQESFQQYMQALFQRVLALIPSKAPASQKPKKN